MRIDNRDGRTRSVRHVTLPGDGFNTVALTVDARITGVVRMGYSERPALLVLDNENQGVPTVERRFFVAQSGHALPVGMLTFLGHAMTQDGNGVFQVYEIDTYRSAQVNVNQMTGHVSGLSVQAGSIVGGLNLGSSRQSWAMQS